jgi:hypothetical protein
MADDLPECLSEGTDKRRLTMSYKSQLLLSSSCERLSIRPAWGTSPANLQGIKLVNPWLDYDSKVRPGLTRRFKLNTVLGITLATAVSASIWTGIILAVARLWK